MGIQQFLVNSIIPLKGALKIVEPDRRRGAKSLVIIIVRSVRPFVRPYVRPYVLKNKKITTTSKVNNSAIFQHRLVLRVANERHCYIFFIFRVIWGEGVKG